MVKEKKLNPGAIQINELIAELLSRRGKIT